MLSVICHPSSVTILLPVPAIAVACTSVMEHQSISPTLPVPIALAVEAAASTKKKKTEARPVPQHGKATNFMPGYVSKTHANAAVPFFQESFFTHVYTAFL